LRAINLDIIETALEQLEKEIEDLEFSLVTQEKWLKGYNAELIDKGGDVPEYVFHSIKHSQGIIKTDIQELKLLRMQYSQLAMLYALCQQKGEN